MTKLSLTTNTSGQKEALINGRRYEVKKDSYGCEYVVVDGKRINLKESLFQDLIDKTSKNLEEAKENASSWGERFDYFLSMVKANRRERISFTREYGNTLEEMNPEQQEQYKLLCAKGSEYSIFKNTALGWQLSYTNQVISFAGSKMNLLNQASIFGC